MRGQFALPVRMAEAMRCDDALFTAYQARVATQSAISLGWSPADSTHGRMWGVRAASSIHLPQHVRESILGTMANHGVAIGYVDQRVEDTDAGPTVVMTLEEWPLEFVRFDASNNILTTRTVDEPTVEIVHGDGRWVIFQKFGLAPWTQDAALLPAAFLWLMHGEGLQSWAGASAAHGRPSIIGELPEGVGLTAADGGLTVEAAAFLQMLSAVISGDDGAGVRPAGSKVDYLSNGSNAWQVFKELIANRESAAARIYLGTDAILGSRGGAPGVDVAALFGIATTRIQGDLEALERGFREGLVEPWFGIHGASLLWAPHVHYELPDIDADKRAEQEAAAIERMALAVKNLKDSGIEVTQPVLNELTRVLGVSVPANLATQERAAVPLQLAPTDVARVVKVREARASQGLPALGNEKDELFISELELPPAPVAPATPALASRQLWADVDGDGIDDGFYLDEEGNKVRPQDHPDLVEARKEIERARRAYEKKASKYSEKRAQLEKDHAAAETHADETETAAEQARSAADEAESAIDDAESAVEEHHAAIAELKSADAERLAQPLWTDENEQPINGHQALAEYERQTDTVEAAVPQAKAAAKQADKDATAAEREFAKAETKRDNLADKVDGLDAPDGDDVESAQEEYVSTSRSIAEEYRKAGNARAASAFDTHADGTEAEIVDAPAAPDAGDTGETDSTAAPDAPAKPDDPHAVQIGPSGGKYYIAPSGAKVYLP